MKIYIAILVLLLLSLINMNCSIEKFFSRQRNDSTSVVKSASEKKDSTAAGIVSTTNTDREETYKWWRMIIENMPKKDTNLTVNNIYPAPARVIYEGGSGRIDEQTTSKDSMWYLQLAILIKASSDSMSRRIENIESQKKSETKGFGLWSLIMVAGGAIIFFKLLSYAGSNFTITKKSRS